MSDKIGRPTDFTQELADTICAELSEGKSLRTVCSNEQMPDKSTVFRWLRENADFRDQYARAKQEASDAMAEDIIDIADDSSDDILRVKKVKDDKTGEWIYLQEENKEFTNRSKLRIETRKWIMAKMKPKKYGEKVDITTGGKPLPLLGGITRDTDNNGDQETGGAKETD